MNGLILKVTTGLQNLWVNQPFVVVNPSFSWFLQIEPPFVLLESPFVHSQFGSDLNHDRRLRGQLGTHSAHFLQAKAIREGD
jgi:hypothetical protein